MHHLGHRTNSIHLDNRIKPSYSPQKTAIIHRRATHLHRKFDSPLILQKSPSLFDSSKIVQDNPYQSKKVEKIKHGANMFAPVILKLD